MGVARRVLFALMFGVSAGLCGVAAAHADSMTPEPKEPAASPSDAGTRRILLRAPDPAATATAAPSATAPAHGSNGALAAFVASNNPADPPATHASKFHVIDLKYERGDVLLLGARVEDLGQPTAAPRVMGRFALELFEGRVLIERVRFDFPMLGATLGEAGVLSDSRLDARLVSSVGVRFPALPRGSRLELVDRKTNARWSLPWSRFSSAPLQSGP